MPCFNQRINNLQPICDVLIHSQIKGKNANLDLSKLQKQSYKALIDTGATGSCVSDRVVSYLNLNPISKVLTTNTTNQIEVNRYKICIFLPIPTLIQKGSQKIQEININSFLNINVSEIKYYENNNFDVILGMDIISKGSLYISNGIYSLCT